MGWVVSSYSQFLPGAAFVCWILILVSVTGCGNRETQQQLDVAEQTVRQSLEKWKSGVAAAELEQADPPVRFHDDDWLENAKLVEFEIRQSYLEPSDQTARCAVTLTIQRPGKRPSEVKCTYQVVTDPDVIVARDPMS